MFFPVVVGLHTLFQKINRPLARVVVLLAGLGFYGFTNYRMIPWMLGFSLFVHLIGVGITKTKTRTAAKVFLAVGVGAVIAALFTYKYWNYCWYLLGKAVTLPDVSFNFMVPLGISYISFSAISLLTDVYRKDAVMGNVFDTLHYLLFFPKVVQGPIVLYKDFTGSENNTVTLDRLFDGLNLVIVGCAKKVLLADYFGSVLATIPATGIDRLTAVGVVVLYAFQLYFDFSGYSDIAIGLAKLLGYDFKANFRFPYTATSITDFWRKWHISLGTFFKEYVYIPLGGNRKGARRTLLNLGVVFVITGVWHGAGLIFLSWGLLHGAVRLFEKAVADRRWYQRIPAPVKWAVTMLVVFLGWQLFRISSLSELSAFFKLLFGFTPTGAVSFTWRYYFTPKTWVFLAIAVTGSFLPANRYIQDLYRRAAAKPLFASAFQAVLLLLFMVTVIALVNSNYSPFMYAQY